MANTITSNTLVRGITEMMRRDRSKEDFVGFGANYREVQNHNSCIQKLINWIAELMCCSQYAENTEREINYKYEILNDSGFMALAEAILKFDRFSENKIVRFEVDGHEFELETYGCVVTTSQQAQDLILQINGKRIAIRTAKLKEGMLWAYLAEQRNLNPDARISLREFNLDGMKMAGFDLTNCDLPDLHRVDMTGATLYQTTFGKVDFCKLRDSFGIQDYLDCRAYQRKQCVAAVMSEVTGLEYFDKNLIDMVAEYDQANVDQDQEAFDILTSNDSVLRDSWLRHTRAVERRRILKEMERRNLTLGSDSVNDIRLVDNFYYAKDGKSLAQPDF